MSRRTKRLTLLGIFLLGFGVRGIYIYQIRDNPFFETPFGDPEYHDRWAVQIARGNWLGEKAFFRAPLYPYLLGLTYKVFGHRYLVPRILQILLGSLSCLLIFLVGKEVFGQKVGLLSAGIASVFGPFIYFEGELLLTSLIVFLDLALILLVLRAKSTWGWVSGGLVLGLSAIARPNILVFLPFLLLWIFLRQRRSFPKYAFAVLGGVLVLVAPVTVRNYLVEKDLVLIASQGGVNFYLGNNAEADGGSAIFPGIGDDWDEVSFAERELGRRLKPSQVSRYYYKKGLQFLKEEPGSFLRLLTKKVYLLLNGYEISNNQYIYGFGEYSSLLKLSLFEIGEGRLFRFAFPFGLISPLGLLGLWLSRKNPQGRLLGLFVLSYSISIVLFFVCSRYRAPLYAIFIPFASFTLFAFKGLRTVLPALIALFWFANSNLYGEDFLNPAQHHFNLGNASLKKGEYTQAIAEYEKVLEMEPAYPRARLNVGVSYHKQGLLERAKEEYRAELENHPQEARACNNLAVILRAEGEDERALEMASRAVQLRPNYGEPWLNLGISYESLGDTEKAAEAYERALEIEPSLAGAYSRLGAILLARGEAESAAENWRKAVQLEPEDPNYRYNLGLAYAKASKYEEAITEFRKSLSIDPDLFPAYHNLGMAYFLVGDLENASHSLKRALSINPDSPESRYLLEVIRRKKGS